MPARSMIVHWVLAAACAVIAGDASSARVADAIRRESDTRLDRVEVSAIEGSDRLFVAVCDTQARWWGGFRCVEFDAGKIWWAASHADRADEPTEQSIHSVKGFRHPNFSGPLIEVFGVTHMGHGNYYLYELRERKLHLLATTFAVDQHHDDRVIRGGALKAGYEHVNSDGRVDVVLTGILDHFDDEYDFKAPPAKSSKCRKVLLWDKHRRAFVEDAARRLGFGANGR